MPHSSIKKVMPVKAWALVWPDNCIERVGKGFDIYQTKKGAASVIKLTPRYFKTVKIIPVLITPILIKQ